MQALLKDPNVLMVLKEQGEGQILEHRWKQVFVMIVEVLHVLGQDWLLLGWFFEIVEHELVEVVKSNECTTFEFE